MTISATASGRVDVDKIRHSPGVVLDALIFDRFRAETMPGWLKLWRRTAGGA